MWRLTIRMRTTRITGCTASRRSDEGQAPSCACPPLAASDSERSTSMHDSERAQEARFLAGEKRRDEPALLVRQREVPHVQRERDAPERHAEREQSERLERQQLAPGKRKRDERRPRERRSAEE